MFKCEFSGEIAEAGTKCHKIVTKRVMVDFPFRSSINAFRNFEGKWEMKPDYGGQGYQILKEINVSHKYYKEAMAVYTFEKTIQK